MDPLLTHLQRILTAYTTLAEKHPAGSTPLDAATVMVASAADSVEKLIEDPSDHAGTTPVTSDLAVAVPVVEIAPVHHDLPAAPVAAPATPVAAAGVAGFVTLTELDEEEDSDDEDDDYYGFDEDSVVLAFSVLAHDGQAVDPDVVKRAYEAALGDIQTRFAQTFEHLGARGEGSIRARGTLGGRDLLDVQPGEVAYTHPVEIDGRELTVAATVHDPYQLPLVDLLVTVRTPAGEPAPEGTVAEAVAQVLPTIVERVGAFEFDEAPVEGADGTLKALQAPDMNLAGFPNSAKLFSGAAVINGATLVVEVRTPGEENLDDVQEDEGAAPQDDLAVGEDTTAKIAVTFSREDGLPLTEMQVRGGATGSTPDSPLGRALGALALHYGHAELGDEAITPGYEQSQQVAVIEIGEEGQRLRAMAGYVTEFAGKLPFPNLGTISLTSRPFAG